MIWQGVDIYIRDHNHLLLQRREYRHNIVLHLYTSKAGIKMPSNPRFPSSTSRLGNILIPRLPRPYVFPLQSVLQPAAFPTPHSVRIRLNSQLSDEWKGTKTEDHAINRAKKGDITDPEMESSAAMLEEREENEGVADRTKSQAATEREGSRYGQKAKKEHPKAPEPVIGMNDEKGRKGD